MNNAMDKLGQDLLHRSRVISTFIADGRYRELGAHELTAGLLAALLLYGVSLVVSRLYLSPIASFPGPKLAAATEWYEFYYQLVKGGQWGHAVEKMHEKYGPIVRTSPWELSVRDSKFYSQLYVAGSTRRTNMWARGREGNGFDNSHHLSVPHDLHRQRRKHLDGFFSRQGINRTEDIIAGQARQLADRLEALKGSESVVHVDHAFSALTGDIIGHVACGANPGLAQDPNFSPAWHELMAKTVFMGPWFRCFPWLNSLIRNLPESLMASIYPKGISNLMVGKMGMEYIEKIKKEVDEDKLGAKDQKVSVFHHLLTSDIPQSEKSSSRLQAESMIFIIAGTFTSAHTLSMIVYHVLSDPKMEKRLRTDLKEAMNYPTQNPRWVDLEKVRYLQAIIKEALRLYGLVGNVARCSPDVALQYKQWTIPKHTPVGMSINFMHTEPGVWQDPLRFNPDRWLGNYDPLMDRNFVAFTKGSRSCLGVNLAMAELYLTTAFIFRPGGPKLSLSDTKRSDVKIVRDFIIGLPDPDARGVRVTVH